MASYFLLFHLKHHGTKKAAIVFKFMLCQVSEDF
jgi:hypothetical protein